MEPHRTALGRVVANNGGNVSVQVFGQNYATMPLVGAPAFIGQQIPVAFGQPDSQRLPVAINNREWVVRMRHKLSDAIALFGLWSIPEGQPHLPLGIGAAFTPGSYAALAALSRTEDSSLVTYAIAKNRTEGSALLATTSATGLVLCAGFKRLANATSGQSSIFRIQETRLSGSVIQNIDLPSKSNLYGWGESSRYFGQLFYWDQGANKPFIYTAVHGSTICSVNRSTPSAAVSTPIKALPHNSGFLDGPFNLAGPFLADCKYQGYNSEGDYPHTESDRCKLQFYKQEENLKWTALPLVDALALVPSGFGSLLQLYPVGLASPWGGYEGREATTETLTADGTTSDFTLANLPFRVTAVRVNGSATPFQVTESVISLLSLPASGDSLAVDYERATGSKIESEFALPILPSRWPHLAIGTKREWWWYLSYRKELSAGFKILATDSATGATSEVYSTARGEDWTGEEISPGIVASQYTAAKAVADATRAPGATETLVSSAGRNVTVGGRVGQINLTRYRRGYFLDPVVGTLQGFGQFLAQPWPDNRRELNGEDWVAQSSESYKSYSRQVASGCHDAQGNHYQIVSELVSYANGIGQTGTSVQTVIEESNFGTYHTWYTTGTAGDGTWFLANAPGEVEVPDNWVYNGSVTLHTVEVFSDRSYAFPTVRRLWKTWLISHSSNKSLRFKVDISLRYDYAADGLVGSPLVAPVHQWACVGDYVVVLRDDYWNKTDDVVTGSEVEPSLYLYNRATGALVATRNLHPTSDAARAYNAGGMRPYMRCHKDSVSVFQHWKLTADASTANDGHSLHVLSLPTLEIQTELWATGTKPTGFPSVAEAYNSVSAEGNLFWLNNFAEIGRI